METKTVLILKVIVNVITFGGLVWAFILHLSNRQSKSYLLIAGYLCIIVDVMLRLSHGIFLGFSWYNFGLWCLSGGEILWFYHMEEKFNKILDFRSDEDVHRYRFSDFKAMPLDIPVRKSGGRILTKLLDEGSCIRLHVEYTEATEFKIESMDFDFAVVLKSGSVELNILGKPFVLSSLNERKAVKMSDPLKIKILTPSMVIITLNKR